ncbi:MAG: glycoside hydrolase family 30 beta sandwich domain-containing protein [Lachnospiraceae bacterium]
MKLELISTVYHNQEELKKESVIDFVSDGGEENELVNLYPQMRYQTFEGFGGALTESAGYIYNQMSKEQQQEMLHQYFNKDEMKYRMVRIPIDSCDFSLGHYEAVENETDREFAGFNLKRVEENIFPLLNDAQAIYGDDLEIMLTPWSPPAYMKTNGDRNHGGTLKEEYKKVWADYICNYIRQYRSLGYRVKRISLQNEPKAVQTWDSCVFTAQEEKEFLRDYLWQSLQEYGLEDVEIFIWDHNKERAFERACAIIDETTDPMITGIAFHWYSGDHFEALRMIHEKFPDKKLILSEACIEYSKFAQDDYLKNAQKYAHDMIGNMNNGMNAFYDWNVLLNEEGGPNHVGNYCDAPFLFDVKEKKLQKRNTAAYIWHFSHFIQGGAVRIGVSAYRSDLECTAFINPDDTVVLVLLNRTACAIPTNIRLGDKMAKIIVEPDSIATAVLK